MPKFNIGDHVVLQPDITGVNEMAVQQAKAGIVFEIFDINDNGYAIRTVRPVEGLHPRWSSVQEHMLLPAVLQSAADIEALYV